MNLLHEFALLFAVAVPIAAIVGLNVFLVACGERGTLLLPGRMQFPSTPLEPAAPVVEPVPATVEAANEPVERIAA